MILPWLEGCRALSSLKCPDLATDLKVKFGDDKLTVQTGIEATIHFADSVIVADGTEYPIDPVGAAAQELIVFGGCEKIKTLLFDALLLRISVCPKSP